MTRDDDAIPDDDAVAGIARRALRRLGEGAEAAGSWDDVRASARRVRQRRLAAAVVVCAVILTGSGVAAVVLRSHDSGNAHIAGPLPTTTTSEPTNSTTSTTSLPPATSAPANTSRSTFTSNPPATAPTTGPVLPASDAPQAGDFGGTITAGSSAVVPPVDVGSAIDINTKIKNTTDHAIWASSSTVPTALATICTGPLLSGAHRASQSLWWMTNVSVAPGGSDGRTGTFTPDSSYEGAVVCELDVVTTDTNGITFDTNAGGDTATATIVAAVNAVPPVTVWVVPAIWAVTTIGGVGPLQFGVSTEADIRAQAGTPDATTQGTFGLPMPDYAALGYDCTDQETPNRIPLHVQPALLGPFCGTIFYLNVDTKTLVGFETTASRYATENGTSVGMSSAQAQQRESKTVQPAACHPSQITLGDLANQRSPGIIFLRVGAKPSDPVTEIVAEDQQTPVGVSYC